ncbi:hypothetical protein SAMN05428978_10176 [Nitrosomonas sp. Nm34]|nr:hypothetical protein SAMN05428978_10176 [Nitrosomonas sp. Nm34]
MVSGDVLGMLGFLRQPNLLLLLQNATPVTCRSGPDVYLGTHIAPQA